MYNDTNNAPLVLAFLLLLFVLMCLSLVIAPAEGAAAPTPIISPTGTPDGHWINPIPWPTYSYPTPESYPAPLPSPTPEAYPEDYHKDESIPFPTPSPKKVFTAEPGPEWSLWAWIWDLGSSLFD